MNSGQNAENKAAKSQSIAENEQLDAPERSKGASWGGVLSVRVPGPPGQAIGTDGPLGRKCS